MAVCLKMIKKPAVNPERFERIWREYVEPLNNAYEMNP
jgi:acyl-CoA dehydrogenase